MKMLTVKQAADALECSAMTVRKHIKSGELAAIDLSIGTKRKTWRIKQADLTAFIMHKRLVANVSDQEVRAWRGRSASLTR